MRIRGSVLALLAMGAVAVAAQSAHGFGTFGDARTYNTGGEVFGIAAGKLNRDRHVDLLVSNDNGDDHISLLRGKGGGKFKRQKRIRNARGPEGLVIARLNGDRRRDFAVAEYNGGEDSRISLYTARRRGKFKRAKSLDAGPGAWLLEAGDLNQDGRLDLVTGNFEPDGSNHISVHLGKGPKGKMRFRARQDYGGSAPVHGIGLARMNGDSRLDVVALTDDCSLSIHVTQPDGSLGSPQGGGVCTPPVGFQLALAGFDAEPGVDVAFGADGSVIFVQGDGAGAFGPVLIIAASPSVPAPNGIATGDLDRDGEPDVAVGNGSGANGFGMGAGLGNGFFAAPDLYSGADGSNIVELARLNRDRGLDVIVGHDSGIGVYVNRP